MSRIGRNISIIIRSERLIAQHRLATFRRQTGLMVAAGIVAAIGLIMLNVAAYLTLAMRMDPAMAALVVSLVNLALAAVLVAAAGGKSETRDMAAVSEVRDLAMEDLEAEIQTAAEELKSMAQNMRAVSRDPVGALAPGAIEALAKILVRNLRKKE